MLKFGEPVRISLANINSKAFDSQFPAPARGKCNATKSDGYQPDKIMESGSEGHGYESSHHRLTSPRGSRLLTAIVFLKNDIHFRLIKKRTKKIKKTKKEWNNSMNSNGILDTPALETFLLLYSWSTYYFAVDLSLFPVLFSVWTAITTRTRWWNVSGCPKRTELTLHDESFRN